MPGCAARNAAIAGGTSTDPALGNAASRRRPARAWTTASSSSPASSSRSRRAAAWRASTAPASVSRTPRGAAVDERRARLALQRGHRLGHRGGRVGEGGGRGGHRALAGHGVEDQEPARVEHAAELNAGGRTFRWCARGSAGTLVGMTTLHTLRVFLGPDGAGGNPLGVLLDGGAVAPGARQAVAADLGFSETVFVDDAASGALRIFTPAVELPLAGHPLVGASWLLARTGTPVDTLRPPAGDVPDLDRGELTWIRARLEWATLYDVAQLPEPADVDAFAVPGGDAMVAVWAWEDEAARARARPRVPERDRDRRGRGDGRRRPAARRADRARHRDPPGRGLRAARASRAPTARSRSAAGSRSCPSGPTRRRSPPDILRAVTGPLGIDTAVILCGGRGTRLHGDIPKPLVEVGGLPIVWHVASILARAGHRAGAAAHGLPRGARRRVRRGGAVARGARGRVPRHRPGHADGRARARGRRPTGPAAASCSPTATGWRTSTSAALAERHAATGALATMTVVRPELPFGVALLDAGDRVTGFHEKPRAEHWVNAGFFVLEPEVHAYLEPGLHARARAARGARGGRAARGLPARGLLGLHGHLQGRARAQRALGGRPRARGRRRAEVESTRHGRSFQVGGDQAQEGDRRRAPRQAVHEARARHHGGGEGGRRRHRGQPVARAGRAEGQGRLDAQGQHRARDREGDRRGRRRGGARGRHLRGLRLRRRGAARRGDDGQPQPHRLRGPPRVHQAQRQPRRARLGRVPVRQEGRRGRRLRRATPRTT